MSKYLKTQTKDKLKKVFSITKSGYLYAPEHRGIPILLTFDDLTDIHDFLVFMSTQEYTVWMKSQKIT